MTCRSRQAVRNKSRLWSPRSDFRCRHSGRAAFNSMFKAAQTCCGDGLLKARPRLGGRSLLEAYGYSSGGEEQGGGGDNAVPAVATSRPAVAGSSPSSPTATRAASSGDDGGAGSEEDGSASGSTATPPSASGACTPSTLPAFQCQVERISGILVHYNPVKSGGADLPCAIAPRRQLCRTSRHDAHDAAATRLPSLLHCHACAACLHMVRRSRTNTPAPRCARRHVCAPWRVDAIREGLGQPRIPHHTRRNAWLHCSHCNDVVALRCRRLQPRGPQPRQRTRGRGGRRAAALAGRERHQQGARVPLSHCAPSQRGLLASLNTGCRA
jgi:hypothetical protein